MKKRQLSHIVAEEDLRWLEIIRRSIDGLAAIAEANAYGCETEWLAMQYGLEAARDIIDGTIEEFKNRLDESEASNG